MGRVGNRYVWQGGQTENQGGQTKKFFRRFAPNFPHPGLKLCRRPCKDLNSVLKDKDQAYNDQDRDKDFTYSYLLQVAAKPTIAIKQQQWTQSESSQHMTVKPITLNK